MADEKIRRLTRTHDRSQFACGHPDLDRFLQQQAMQSEARDLSRTHVIAWPDDRVKAYFTTRAFQIGADLLPLSKKGPRDPVPVFLLARMAVDGPAQRSGLGRLMLRRCIEMAVEWGDLGGCVGMLVDAKSDEHVNAVPFYEQFGFSVCSPPGGSTTRMFLPTATLRQALAPR